jgi:O-antigen/teichoic acid export membrane protein
MGNYRKKYLKNYFWQFLGFFLSILSMFVVTPLITNMPVVYGIYTVCISLTIFLNYADLGFLMAGEKFAAESYSKKDPESERAFIGTSVFIYLIVCTFILLCVVIFAWNPSLLIRDIGKDSLQYDIAQKLLLILSLSIPFTVVQKYVFLIYKIRLESYKIQRVGIVGSLLIILSVPFVFFNNQYDIVGYYLFSQVIMGFIPIYYLFKSRECGYPLREIIKSVCLDKAKFVTMKGLAFSGFISCICWMLCYELDLILISTLLGAQMVALYAIGRNMNNMIRSVLGIVYSPYFVRFNYYVGEDDNEGMKKMYYSLVCLFSYFTVIPIVVFIFFAKPFIVAWVGDSYIGAVMAVQFLVICFLPNYFSSPAGYVVTALNQFKGILVVSILQLIVFYLCFFSLLHFLDISAMAIAKCMINFVGGIYYLVLVSKLFGDSCWHFVRSVRLVNLIFPCMVAIVFSFFALPLVGDVEKSSVDLMKVITVMMCVIFISLLSAFLTDRSFRKILVNVIKIR